MSKDYKAYAGEVDARAANLFKAAPETMRAYRGLMEAASKDGALDAKTKELMALRWLHRLSRPRLSSPRRIARRGG